MCGNKFKGKEIQPYRDMATGSMNAKTAWDCRDSHCPANARPSKFHYDWSAQTRPRDLQEFRRDLGGPKYYNWHCTILVQSFAKFRENTKVFFFFFFFKTDTWSVPLPQRHWFWILHGVIANNQFYFILTRNNRWTILKSQRYLLSEGWTEMHRKFGRHSIFRNAPLELKLSRKGPFLLPFLFIV